jgi:hypothetical protein
MRSLGDPNWPLLLGVANFQKIMHELCRTARPVEMAMFLQSIEDSGAVIPADFLDRAGGAAWPTTPFLDPDTLEPSLPDMDNIAALRQSKTPAAARPVATSTSGREAAGAEMKGSVDATADGASRGTGGGEVDNPPALLGWLEARKQHLSAVLVGQQLEKRACARFCPSASSQRHTRNLPNLSTFGMHLFLRNSESTNPTLCNGWRGALSLDVPWRECWLSV